MNKEFYVYEYRHPITKTPFYVGKGAGRRYLQHLNDTHNQDFKNELENLKREGLSPEIEKVFFSSSEDIALRVEEHLVQSYGIRKNGGLLCNYLDKCFSANTVDIPEDVYNLMGTMTDKELGNLTGINWSTLRTKRMNRGIKSFNSTEDGRRARSEKLRKKDIYTLYNSNSVSITGTLTELAEQLSTKSGTVSALIKGKNKHIKGFYTNKTVAENSHTVYRNYTFIHESGDTFSGTYREFAMYAGLTESACSNLAKNYTQSLYGWVVEGTGNTVFKKCDETIYTFAKLDGTNTFKGLRLEFEKYSGLSSGDISNLLSGYQNSSKGWIYKGIVDE